MKPLCPAAITVLGAAVAELGALPSAASTAKWWSERISGRGRRGGFGDLRPYLDREIARELAAHVGARPSLVAKPKPVRAKVAKKAAPVVVVSDDEDCDCDPDDEDCDCDDEEETPMKTKRVGSAVPTFKPHTARDGSTLTLEASYGAGPRELALTRPSAREKFVAALGMPPAVAAIFTDAELTAVAPSFVAMAKRNR